VFPRSSTANPTRCVGAAAGEALAEGLAADDALALGDADAAGLAEADGLASGEVDAAPEGLAAAEALGDGLAEGEPLAGTAVGVGIGSLGPGVSSTSHAYAVRGANAKTPISSSPATAKATSNGVR
jgi:hypothetical protein